jgi:hypothetical protein
VGDFEISQVVAPGGGQRQLVGQLRNGRLEQTAVALGNPTRRDNRRLDGVLTITLTLDGERLTTVTADATIERPAPGPTPVDQTTDAAARRYRITIDLGGDPLRIRGVLSAARETTGVILAAAAVATELPLVDARLVEDPEVRQPSNALHQTARGALDIIAAGLADPGFADRVAKRLFPVASTEITSHLRVARDWVMFQHRAERIAITAAPVQVVLPARSFDVYEASLADEKSLAALREALRSGDREALNHFAIRAIDRVRFTGGTANLESPSAGLLAAWQARGPGATIIAGAVAVHGQSEGGIERARLARVAEVVSVASAIDPEVSFDVLPEVPAPLDVSGIDGVMVIATLPAKVENTCVDVRYVSLRRLNEVRGVNADTLAGLLGGATLLGSVGFEGITVTTGLGGAQQGWQAAGVETLDLAVAIAGKGDERAGSEADVKARATTIVNALGGGADVTTLLFDADLDGDCPVVLVVSGKERQQEPEPEEPGARHDIWVVLGRDERWTAAEGPLRENFPVRDVLERLDQNGIVRQLGWVQFKRGMVDRVESHVRRLSELDPPFSELEVSKRLAIFERAGVTDDPDLVRAQASDAAAEVRAPGDVDTIETHRPLDVGRVVLLIVLGQEG